MPAKQLFRIKICGIASVRDAALAVEAGADAIGLNFWPRSPRCVSRDAAREIANAALGGLTTVGVFVNAPADEVARTADEFKLGWIQLHGDEPPEMLAQLPSHLGIIRASRTGTNGLLEVRHFLDECHAHDRVPNAILVDADAGSNYGGTGRTANWSQIRNERGSLGEIPIILAGGLNPDNVAEAIATVRPHGVDVASGVEFAPGLKDPKLVHYFVDAARDAFAKL